MPIERSDWLSPFNHLPRWRCPRCARGHLSIRQAEATKGEETRASRVNRANSEFAPEWMEHRFATMVACDNPACREVVSVTGVREGYEDCTSDSDGNYWRERLHINGVTPGPMPIEIPSAVPPKIREPIERAAQIYWSSSASAGNALRQAVERYLDFKGVRASELRPNAPVGRKRRRLALGERFADFEKRLKGDATFLSAVRWLGNVASHEGDLDPEHVLTAFEMIEHILEDQFVGQKKLLAKRAKEIERSKGRSKPRTPAKH